MTNHKHILQQVASGQLSHIEAYKLIADSEVARLSEAADERPGPAPAPAPAESIAVIGMSARLPGSPDLDAFWLLLRDARSAITEVPAQRWDHAAIYDPKPAVRGRSYARRGGFVDRIDEFDARFFRVSPREARFLDPQQRVFMQECWRAIEAAGYATAELAGSRTGVFVGCKGADYQLRLQTQDLGALDLTDSHLFGGNDISMLPARIAYFLDLRGPAVPINTACSSSLVALHFACESLVSGQSELAIAAGVEFMTTPGLFVSMASSEALSRSGSCNAFSSDSDGLVLGEGACVVVLKPLARALADGDHIHGVVRASGINQDGKSAGINAPNGDAQTKLEVAVYERAGINPEQLGYVEAHGTATALGDPIEFHALSDAFRRFTQRERFCPIGTVKTNIGHPLSAAGLAGLIKVLLSLEHEQLPASLNFCGYNRLIEAERSPFFVNTELRPWPRTPAQPRLAAVSSFGFSGTNAHLVVEEAPPRASADAADEPALILLSAKTEAALRRKLRELGRWCRSPRGAESGLANLAYTLHRGRDHFGWRAAWVVDDLDELAARLELAAEQGPLREAPAPAPAKRALAAELDGLLASRDKLDSQALRGVLVALAGLYLDGLVPGWTQLHARAERRRVPAPVYPFEGRSYWLDAPTSALLWPPVEDLPEPQPARPSAPAATAAVEVETYYLRSIWLPAPGPAPNPDAAEDLLVFDDDDALSEQLRGLAPTRRLILVRPRPGPTTLELDHDLDDHRASCDPHAPGAIADLLEQLARAGLRPRRVVLAWPERAASFATDPQARIDRGLLALLELCQALMSADDAPAHIVIPHTLDDEGCASPEVEALAAFARTLASESRRVACRSVAWSTALDPERLLAELDGPTPPLEQIRWRGAQRLRAGLERWTPSARSDPRLRREGVYLLVGGAGGIGLRLARHLGETLGAKLMIAGRTPPPADATALADAGELAFTRCDVTRRDEVEALIAATKRRYGRLDGVIHLAGVLADSLVANKTRAEAAAVLGPKLLGLAHLDEATRDEPLDCFVAFSSLAAQRGNPGQSDYAYANAFLDAFMRRREAQRRAGRRRGASLAIDWPQWAGSGMSLGAEDREVMRSLGLAELPADAGFAALELLLRTDEAVVAVCRGEARAVDALLVAAPASAPTAAASAPASSPAALLPEVRRLLVELFAEVTEHPVDEVDTATSFEEFGVDSVMVKSLNVKLVRELGELPKTLMFECQTLDELADYLVEHHGAELERRLGPRPPEPGPAARTRTRAPAGTSPAPLGRRQSPTLGARAPADEIAIIGLAGRYPGAPDLDALWSTLCAGRDEVSEIPATRWPVEDYYDPDPAAGARGKMYCKWGGFLPDIDRFDARFFRISPREAETMDPQERLFLECAWQAFEDSGYSFPLASPRAQPPTRSVAVFVGVTTNTYQLLGPEQWQRGNYDALPSSSPWSIANRVSYLFGLHGPSMTVDTACSSSLVAIHLACESLRRGESELALVGGVNLYTHPSKYVVMCRMHMLSRRGRSHAFGALADGFVPGEGVGAVLLKPYAAALADGDDIRAIVKGSAINHGGKTTSYTVPSPRAQAELINAALTRAGLEPRQISYVEAHGTGTELGDPIELRGLEAAYGGAEEPCAIASIKSNIGHLEAAAGVAGLTKLVLQLQHRTLVPSLHAEQLNPNLDLGDSRFHIQREAGPWPSPSAAPRRAGLSSFGAGGTNAHVIVEEFIDERGDAGPQPALADRRLELLVLSAADAKRLRARARALLTTLELAPPRRLSDLAYTLQVGRVALPVRFAAAVDSSSAAIDALRALLAGTLDPKRHALGEARGSSAELGDLLDGPEGQAFVAVALRERKLAKLGKLWTRGFELDWSQLHEGPRRRVSLPSYPFAGERHWVGDQAGASSSASAALAGPHPMLAANTSTLRGLSFALALDPRAHWFRDHEVLGKPVIPGVGLLEAVRAAGELAGEAPITRLRRFTWLEPLALSGAAQRASVRLYPRADALGFEVESSEGEGRDVHARGVLEGAPLGPRPRLELEPIKARCSPPIAAETVYPDERSYAPGVAPPVRIGASLRSLRQLWLGRGEVLVRLERPASASTGQVLDVAILDGAVQATAAYEGIERAATRSMFPLSVDEVLVHAPLPGEAYAHLRVVSTSGDGVRGTVRFDIVIADPSGEVVVELRGYVARTIATTAPSASGSSPATAAPTRVLVEPRWQLARLPRSTPPASGQTLLVLGGDPRVCEALAATAEIDCVVHVSAGAAFEALAPARFRVRPDLAEDYTRLFEALAADGRDPTAIAHCWTFDLGSAALDPGELIERGPLSLHALAAGLGAARAPSVPRRVLIPTRSADGDEQPGVAALGAFARAVNQERGALTLTRVDLCDPLEPEALAKLMLDEWAAEPTSPELRYRDGLRYARALVELDPAPTSSATGDPWSELPRDANVVIAGGSGGLGATFARSLAAKAGRVLLLARSPAGPASAALIDELRELGVEASYASVELDDEPRVAACLAEHRARWGPFSALIHAAGALSEGYLGDHDPEQIHELMSTRVHGTLALDRASAEDPLTYFLLCSSFSAVLGSPAQGDAAYAHAFMDHFAHARARAVAAGHRRGRTLAINWPLWRVGRVGDVAPAVVAWLERSIGVRRLEPASGVELLSLALTTERAQIAVFEGHGARIRAALLDDRPAPRPGASGRPAPARAAAPAHEPAPALAGELAEVLRHIAAELLKLPVEQLSLDQDLSELGFESITTIDFTNAINERYGIDAMPTMFFEQRTLAQVADRLIDEYGEVLAGHTRERPERSGDPTPDPRPPSSWPPVSASLPSWPPALDGAARDELIAIVGISGAMPGSADLDEFWRNLVGDRELIVEIPPSRWDWRAQASDDFAPRWAGLMKHIDRFDPLFWGISPREAALMDPQHRLVLEHSWRALEDGAIRPSSLAGSRTGVFLGVANADYADLIRERLSTLEAHGALGVSQCILPNRVSFMLDLRGPSQPINTGCSSAVVAIHRAVEAIRNDDCELAIAGGVHVLLNPLLPTFFGLAGAHSDDHRLRAFDKHATGTLLGEGVGVVVLKPLRAALADGNPIHALLRASGENHGGKAPSLTAPNPDAQLELLESVYGGADVDPATIDYIEAHGTGTLLGDPIELSALRKAFTRLHQARGRSLPSSPPVAVSSVKSNVGHLMTAAGIASVLKVVLALGHETLPGTRHFEELNPFSDLSGSPFVVRSDHRPWPPASGASGLRRPRRAGVSSFGMGGSNAHVVIEEYINEQPPRPVDRRAQLIVLSARTEAELRAQLDQLRAHLREAQPELASLAWTLQHGREAMDQRVAILADDLPGLAASLALAVEPGTGPGIWRSGASIEPPDEAELERLFTTRALDRLAQLWSAGVEIDWARLHGAEPPPRAVHLPTYPFAPMRCWLDDEGQTIFELASSDPETPTAPPTDPPTELLYYGYAWREAPAPAERVEPRASTLVLHAGGASLGRALDTATPLPSARAELSGLGPLLESLHAEGRLPAQIAITSDYRRAPVDALFVLLQTYAELSEKRRLRRIVVAHPLTGEHADPGAEALAGFVTSVPPLFSRLRVTLVGLDADARSDERSLLTRELALDGDAEIRHVHGRREARRVQRLPLAQPSPPPSLGRHPVVVISGGAGGLGLIFARYFAERYQARLALLGRSALDARKREALDELRELGGEAIYLSADVSDRVQLGRALATTRERLGPIRCVLHSAGVANQVALTNKSHELFRATLAPKIAGTRLLDELSARDPVELFVLFSSTSVQFGDMGQADYAVGNRFMDSFAAHREHLGRPGRSLVINWPLWREGGFRLRDADEQAALAFSGMSYLEIDAGLAAFERIRAQTEQTQVVVVPTSQRERIEQFLGLGAPAVAKPAPRRPASAPRPADGEASGDLSQRLVARLTGLASSILDLEAAQIDPQTDLVRFGLDSLKVAEFISALNESFPELDLSQAEMFGRQTIAELAELLLDEHGEVVAAELGASASQAAPARAARRRARELVEVQVPARSDRPPSFWVPGSYGFSQSFTALPEVLGPDYPIYAFHARGNDGKRMPFGRHEDMVAHYLACAREVHPGGPWWLGGYSFGGLVALEMAHQLTRAGETVGGLVLFDTYPPTQWIYDMTQREADVALMMIVLANFLAGAKDFEEVIHLEDLDGVPERLYIARLVELIVERGTTKLSPDDLFGIFRGSSEVNDYASEVYRSYDPPPYTASKVLYVRSGPGLDHYIADYDYVGVWRELIPAGLDVVELPFGHAEIMDKPALELVKPRLVDFLG